MAGGINIQFVADVGKFLGRTKDVEKALDETADALDDLAREADRAGDKMGDGLKDGAKEAERATEKLERKFKDTFDEAKSRSRKAGDDIGDNLKRGAREAEGGLDNLKEEARDTARETAASFDGTADSLVGMVQETAANALGGFGPIGVGAGLAIAAGAGVAYTAWQEKTERIKERVASMYDDLLESGQDYLSRSIINDEIGAIGRGEGTGAIRDMDTAQRLATASGASLSDVLRAVAGDSEASARVTQHLAERYAGLAPGANSARADLNQLHHALLETGESSATASARAQAVREAMVTTGDAARDWAAAQAQVGDAVSGASEAIRQNNETITDGATRARENQGALADLAGELLGVQDAALAAGVQGDDLTRVQREQAAQFLATAAAAGVTTDEALALAEQYGLIPPDVATQIRTEGTAQAQTDIRTTQGGLDGLAATRVSVPVSVKVPTAAEIEAEFRRALSGVVLPPVSIRARPGVELP